MTKHRHYRARMRWGLLFGDMEAQLEEALRLDRESSAGELERAEFARVLFLERLRGAETRLVTLDIPGVGRLDGVVRRVGADWLIVEGGTADWLVPVLSIRWATGLVRSAMSPADAVWGRLGMAAALRTVSRDRSTVRVFLEAESSDPVALSGVIARVGADFLELWDAAGSESGRRQDVAAIPFAAIRAVRSGLGSGVFRES